MVQVIDKIRAQLIHGSPARCPSTWSCFPNWRTRAVWSRLCSSPGAEQMFSRSQMVRLLTTKLAKQSRAFRCQPAGYTLSRGRPAVLEVPLSLQFLPSTALRWLCCPRACPAPSSCRPSAPSDPKHSWKVPVLWWLWDVVTKFILLSRYRSVHLGCNATEHLLLVPSQYEWRFQTVMCCMMFSGS